MAILSSTITTGTRPTPGLLIPRCRNRPCFHRTPGQKQSSGFTVAANITFDEIPYSAGIGRRSGAHWSQNPTRTSTIPGDPECLNALGEKFHLCVLPSHRPATAHSLRVRLPGQRWVASQGAFFLHHLPMFNASRCLRNGNSLPRYSRLHDEAAELFFCNGNYTERQQCSQVKNHRNPTCAACET